MGRNLRPKERIVIDRAVGVSYWCCKYCLGCLLKTKIVKIHSREILIAEAKDGVKESNVKGTSDGPGAEDPRAPLGGMLVHRREGEPWR